MGQAVFQPVKTELKKSQVLMALIKMSFIKTLLEYVRNLSTGFDESIIRASDKYLAHHLLGNIHSVPEQFEFLSTITPHEIW